MLAGMAPDSEQPSKMAAFDNLRPAYEAAVRAVESSQDRYEAYLLATELAETMRQLTMRAGKLRAAIAVRIADEEELSLGDLAVKLNLSKTRAAQLVRKGRGKPRSCDARVGGWGVSVARGYRPDGLSGVVTPSCDSVRDRKA